MSEAKQTVFQIGEARVEFEEVRKAKAPSETECAQCASVLEESVDDGARLLTALGVAAKDCHPWLAFSLFATNSWFTQRRGMRGIRSGHFPEFVAKLVNDFFPIEAESDKAKVQPLLKFVETFRNTVVAAEEQKFYHLGASWTSHADILQATEPSDHEMAQMCNVLGILVSSGVPILEATRLTAETVTHPWLVMAIASMDIRVREGDSLAGGLKWSIEEFIWNRFAALAQEANIPERKPSERPAKCGDFRIEKIERTMSVSDLIIPDMLRYFRHFLHVVDMGEETGELDTVLFRLRDHYLNHSTKQDTGKYPWSEEVSSLIRDFSHFQSAGLPILRSLRIMADSGHHHSLRVEIERICESIEAGCTLSEAMEECGGQLAGQVLVALIRAGEMSGALDVILERIAK